MAINPVEARKKASHTLYMAYRKAEKKHEMECKKARREYFKIMSKKKLWKVV